MLAQLLLGAALLAAAWVMWWFVPRFTEWVTPARPSWEIWVSKVIAAAVFAIPAAYLIIGAFN
jgi:hypothetical protein